MPEIDSQNYVLGYNFLIFLFSILIRWCIGLHSYSGEKTPPMFGDYEAQRHWMEITYNLPIKEWYKNTDNNNLTYWGLDYPPLTAYHSYIYGVAASYLVPHSIGLHSSRGHESYDHKLFMRYSVLIADLLVYIPAVYWYFATCRKRKEVSSSSLYGFLSLLYPGLILIDYGHFQYNCVSLGFFVAAVTAVMREKFKTAAVLFCLAVNYKQMELYHSLPFFFYFLGRFFSMVRKRSLVAGLKFIVPIALTVLVVFGSIWFPFASSNSDIQQVLRRVFPVYRGIYEDKVSSFWCMFNIIYKLHQFDNDTMLKICFFVTVLSVLPSVIDLTINPSFEKFKLSLCINSLCFFLFSFHVHEKSILLAAVPVLLNYPKYPVLSFWFLFVSTFSMLPLFIKDGLFLPFLALFVLYYLCFVIIFRLPVVPQGFKMTNSNIKTGAVFISFVLCIVLSVLSRFCPAPVRYPYLWPLFVSCFSFGHFSCFLAYYYYKQCGHWVIKNKKS
ncbi:dolichyl pyrophosphate Man9GlcNAc2 alpha-1,3-glucosyltransferase isoform X1 [Planococcus citri]|uniref:dolichyl pyrophosphate Man9GlcNAc2 alpha-1,3-glucosyltransferase isoform X1 n=1 Tax=Planococcus citri TaxID=170843 RepID=UPI0031F82F7F